MLFEYVEAIKEVFRVFKPYERLARRSEMEFNAAKAEILVLNTGRSLAYDIEYCGQNFEIKTAKELKICLWIMVL
jgi:hypothetical protein